MTPEQIAEMALYSYLFIKKSGGLQSSRLLFFAEDFWDRLLGSMDCYGGACFMEERSLQIQPQRLLPLLEMEQAGVWRGEYERFKENGKTFYRVNVDRFYMFCAACPAYKEKNR